MKYYKTSLKDEDAYEDSNCADYERKDYFVEALSEDEGAEKKRSAKGRGRRTAEESEAEELDFYKKHIRVERGEDSRKRYARLAELARTGSAEMKKQAHEEACLYMKGVVRDFITQRFRTYVERDPAYAEDLEQEAYFNIMKNLPGYDPDKGLPSTYFFRHIQSAMVSTTNQMKHSITSTDAALKRKLKKTEREFKALGREPTLVDYMIETGETMSKIRSLLRMMDMDMNTHLEAIEEYDQRIAGNPHNNSIYDSPENIVIQRIVYENVLRRMKELFDDREISIFMRNAVDEESIPAIARALGMGGADDKIRRIIEKIRHSIAYDPKIRSLCSGYIKQRAVNFSVVTIKKDGMHRFGSIPD